MERRERGGKREQKERELLEEGKRNGEEIAAGALGRKGVRRSDR